MEQPKEYYAFISYKREDEKWAKWLQDKLYSHAKYGGGISLVFLWNRYIHYCKRTTSSTAFHVYGY